MSKAAIKHVEELILPENLAGEDKGKNRLRNQINDLCRTKKPTVEILQITPEMATVMLERNVENNRNQSKVAVNRYKREISEGRMALTNQGIGFNSGGKLIDGQHRLMACVESGKPFQSIVAFGLDPDSFMFVDSGYKRSAGHKVGMAGFSDANRLAAAARIVLIYDMSKIDLKSGSLGIQTSGKYDAVPDEFIVDYCRETPEFVALKRFYQQYRKFKPITISLFHAVHWIIRQKHPHLADNFIEQMCFGEGLRRDENVYRLRERLLAIQMSNEKLPKSWQMCWMIDAFNDTRRGKATKFIMVAGRDFPRVLS
jgi:hypothetical protein